MNNMFFFCDKQKGAVLVEVLVAVSIMTIVFMQLSGVAARTLAFSYQALKTSEASFLLEEGAEATKTIRDADWNTIASVTFGAPYYFSFANGMWTLSSTNTPIDGFTRTVTFSKVYRDSNADIASSGTFDPGTLLATVSVSWKNGSATATKTISMYIANIFN